MFNKTLTLAKDVSLQEDRGMDVSAYKEILVRELGDFPDTASGALQRLKDQVEFPANDLAPEDFVVADQKLFKLLREVDDVFRALTTYVEIADKFDLDAADVRTTLVRALNDGAANRSVFLEMALNDVAMLRSSIATLPANENLAGWLNASQKRVQMTAKAMQDMIAMMKVLGLETRQYSQQVITATGEITTDVLDVGLIAGSPRLRPPSTLIVLPARASGFSAMLSLNSCVVFWTLKRMVPSNSTPCPCSTTSPSTFPLNPRVSSGNPL